MSGGPGLSVVHWNSVEAVYTNPLKVYFIVLVVVNPAGRLVTLLLCRFKP